jgi:rSAM/selenodomain-associated transferase 1
MKTNRHLVVFAKEPKMGRVKTRLGHDIGILLATRFYRRTVADVLRHLGNDGRWKCWLYLSPDKATQGKPFWPNSFTALKQGGGDIGERMGRAMVGMPPGPVVIIGTDVPTIRPHHIEAAFKAFGRHDVVFGPALDGGYWLVGARRSPCTPELFKKVRWSSKHSLTDSLAKAEQKKLKVALLDTLEDVDNGGAYHRSLIGAL